ncbi:MAG: 1,4-alpha-glucan branching protein GlgB [Pirellulales bacterium]|nr:1,4-alpha-glucan branching protein GlgB [Thermoguttaceae bacterium]MDD4786392.1 1,4-alpha-glucan branching protein GlgB [Pirellulales bacterium]NLZ01860.1 1,4-alpha-glucan branching protein GlgB [Pirellulaceae bacterium]
MRTNVLLEKLGQLIDGRYENPFELLGPHEVEISGRRALAVRAFLPHTEQAWVVDGRHAISRPMQRIHPAGLYEAICPASEETGRLKYMLRVAENGGENRLMHDPYAFPHLLSDYDLHLLNEGTHWRCYEKLGAQLRTVDGVEGVNFAVWAPNATSVSLVGDFNAWDGRRHPMRKHIPSGFWELFVPGLSEGTLYKFQIRRGSNVFEKCDPFAFGAEVPPLTASKVIDLNRYRWHDGKWIERRQETNWLDQPISIYEVHLGSWRRPGDDPTRWLTYRELAHQIVEYVKEMGYTHIELLPISEHPLSASWGYQTVGYYAATSRYGTPQDFMYFVDLCHQNDIGVILDWVPAHFPRDGHGLRRFDGTALYEHEDPRQGEHRDWGTHIFNYGRHEVRNFLVSNVLFWFDKYHIDGVRVDAVASMLYLDYSRKPGDWIPNKYGGRENLEAIRFLKEFNEQVHLQFPGALTIAEESTAWPGVSKPTYLGGLGFSLKWNMGWMNDTLRYMHHDPIHRKYHHDELTFSLIYAFHENFVLPFSHDEVVHGKGSLLNQVPGDLWQKFANLRLLYTYLWTHPGKKLLFMGSEFGQWLEWNFDASLQWDLLQWESHQGLKRCVADLNRLYRGEQALHRFDFDGRGFEWIDCHNYEQSTFSYIRKAEDSDDFVVVCLNFTPMPRIGHRIGVPKLAWYDEVFNSDSMYYAGSNIGNGAGIPAEDTSAHGRPASLLVTLPPLGAVVLKPRR